MHWELDEYKHRPWRVVVRELAEFAAQRIRDTQLGQVASSLTLTTVLSMVPLVAVLLVSFAVFPAFADRRAENETLIFSTLLPGSYSVEILGFVRAFGIPRPGLDGFRLGGLACDRAAIDQYGRYDAKPHFPRQANAARDAAGAHLLGVADARAYFDCH